MPRTQRRRRDRLVLTAAAILTITVLYLGIHLGAALNRSLDRTRSDVTCTEDMDCWDCERMGNRQCGPRP